MRNGLTTATDKQISKGVMRNMRKTGLIAGILTFAAVSFITFGLTGNTAKALEKGETINREGVVYKIEKMPEGENAGKVVITDWDGEGSTVRIYANIESDGYKFVCSEMEDNAFANEKSIKYVYVSAACELKKIPTGAFSGCTNLKEIQLNMNTLTSIGKNAFKNCKNLTKITIRSDKLKKANLKKNSFLGVGDITVYIEKMKCEKYADWIEGKGGAESAVAKAAKD